MARTNLIPNRNSHSSALFVGRRVAWAVILLLALAAPADAHPDHDDEPTTRPVAGLPDGDRCLALFAENLADGPGNWFAYLQFSAAPYTFEKGDHLEYDVYLPDSNPDLKGGVDFDFVPRNLPAEFGGRPWARDHGFEDQHKLRLHGDAILKKAKDAWYHRSFDLSRLAGISAERWNAQFEGDPKGHYVQFLDNVRITRSGMTVLSIYLDQKVVDWSTRGLSGYSQKSMVTTMLREDVAKADRVAEARHRAESQAKLRSAREQFRTEMNMATAVAKKAGDDKLMEEVRKAAAMENDAAFESGDSEAYLDSLHRARHAVSHVHPMMQKYTGHLVGHAHIDLQWLWTWDESINDIIPHTFGQAVKFLDEFPEFTFSQSSATLYLATERYHPELFKRIKEYVQKGRWEIVGGRWCEGDTNLISPESHVRHFLYGQRYFQDRFGKMCTVGWEPDTFGHTWAMPQMLKKSGIDSYYFCRAGKGNPLFWWEGPDGSKVLAFEEPATGGWYNDSVGDAQVKELIDFVLGTGAQDHLMVYGVGNHGGGPTREYIEAALGMKDRKPWPQVKFSTASEFFKRLHAIAYKLTIPTIKSELNPVFDGCYTTHSRVKRGNRMCETALESTEVYATLASAMTDAPYPTIAFRNLWTDVLFNHHHDTLPGSFIHPASLYTAELYDGVLSRCAHIQRQAQDALIQSTPFATGGQHVVVFNPTSWVRSDAVDVDLTLPPGESFLGIQDETGAKMHSQTNRVDEDAGKNLNICFLAQDVPPMAYKVFTVSSGRVQIQRKREPGEPFPPAHIAHIHGAKVPGDKSADAPPGPARPHYQILHEKPGSGTAWTIQPITKTESIDKVVFEDVIESGPVRTRTRRTYRWDRSTIIEDEVRYTHTPRIDYELTVEWLQIGNPTDGSVLLKAAFDSGLKDATATAEIPYADISRPADGKEYPTLKWCDLSNGERGVTILNDCKHGYDAKDGVLRMTMLRSSYDPDPTPDVGMHKMSFSVLPHDGALNKADAARAAWAFNKPLSTVVVPDRPSHDGKFPPAPGARQKHGLEWTTTGLLRIDAPNVLVTALKRAEDGDGWIVRAYECTGQKTTAQMHIALPVATCVETNLIEIDDKATTRATLKDQVLTAEFGPYEIRTFRLK